MALVTFHKKHREYSIEEHEAAIETYRAWLDTHGRYGKLYMMNIGKRGHTGESEVLAPAMDGINIYDEEIAILFRLTFEI